MGPAERMPVKKVYVNDVLIGQASTWAEVYRLLGVQGVHFMGKPGAAEGPSALGGNPGRNGARGDAARLQQDHLSRLDERRRHARRLAGARRSRDDNRARSPHRLSNRFDERIDRESDQ